jgi:hypothetical protein
MEGRSLLLALGGWRIRFGLSEGIGDLDDHAWHQASVLTVHDNSAMIVSLD